MESFGCYQTRRRRIKARVSERMRFWRDLDLDLRDLDLDSNLSNLIDEDKEECWYPRKNASSKVAKAMQPKTDGTWHRCPVKIIASADTYSDARRKLSDAERKADLTTDGETPSKRKRKPSSKYQRHSSEDESDSCGEDDLPPKPPHGLMPSVSQGGRHSTVPPSASPKRHHSGRQSPISVRKSQSMRRSSGSQSPSSASEYRVRRSSGSQGPTCPNCPGPTVYRSLIDHMEKQAEHMEKQAEDIRVIKTMLNLVLDRTFSLRNYTD